MARISDNDRMHPYDMDSFNGFIIIPRSILYFILKDGKLSWQVSAYVDLMNSLTCKAKTIIVSGTAVQLQANEKRLGNTYLSKRWGVSTGAVRFFMAQLEKINVVSRRVIAIKKKSYNLYVKNKTNVIHNPIPNPTPNPIPNPIPSFKAVDFQLFMKETSTVYNSIQNPTGKPITSTNIKTLISTINSTIILGREGGTLSLKERNYIKAFCEVEAGKFNASLKNQGNAEKEKIPKKRKAFEKPTFEDLAEHITASLQKKGYDKDLNFVTLVQTEANKFINYYESNGWKVGKNKMSSWKHSATGWINRMEDFKTNQNGISSTKSNTANYNRTGGGVSDSFKNSLEAINRGKSGGGMVTEESRGDVIDVSW